VVINPNVSETLSLETAEYVGGYWEMIVLPSDENREIYLHFKETEIINGEEKIISREIYPIRLDFYTYRPPTKEEFKTMKEEFDWIRIYSEIPLPEDLLQKLHQLHRVFDKFTFPPKVYIFEVEDEESRGGSYGGDKIELPSNIFTCPIFSNEGITKLFHELSHSVVDAIISNTRDQRANRILFTAYEQLVRKAGWKIPVPTFSLLGAPEEIENNPYFSIFDESSYVKKVQKNYGHPYSDHNELFASALTVFRFFPYEFVQRYNQLASGQKVVASVVRAIFDALESINPKREDINDLLPQQALLRKVYQK